MAHHVYHLAVTEQRPLWEGLLVAEMYARMAATSGNGDHVMRLVEVLLARLEAAGFGPVGDAGPNVALSLQAEILATLDVLADAQWDPAIKVLGEVGPTFAPMAFDLAAQITGVRGPSNVDPAKEREE